MSNHQKEAGIAEFVGPLLKRLTLAKEEVRENSGMEKFIDQISTEVEKTKDIIYSREKMDRELIGYFGKIERQIDPLIDHKHRVKASHMPKKITITEVGESSNRSYPMNEEDSTVQEFIDSLDPIMRNCLKSLSIFPENTELKKRLMIYGWMTLFWVTIEHSEWFFSKLVDQEFFIPIHREHKKEIDRFTIKPTFHKGLISYCETNGYVKSDKREEGTWHLYKEDTNYPMIMLLNLDHRYLDSKVIMDISNEYDRLEAVQLGSCHYTETGIHNGVEKTGSKEIKLKDHIEVDQIDFLKKLGKNIKFLSLRGISGIVELYESIGQLEDLMILDLRACHNLEKLPQKPRSKINPKLITSALPQEKWFNMLMVLDISECYLLDHMPKWVCELSKLEVLKGFVVGSMRNKSQPCTLGDLSKLNNLRKLSIRIVIDILSPEVFKGFNSLDSLLVLTIIWGEKKYNKEIPYYSLPKNLEKLDIRCYPEADSLKLKNPEELENLKRLYIRGGNLTKIPYHDNWKVEILRLRFLKMLVPTDWKEVRSSFNNLKYVEYVGCPKPENFPNKDGCSWRNGE